MAGQDHGPWDRVAWTDPEFEREIRKARQRVGEFRREWLDGPTVGPVLGQPVYGESIPRRPVGWYAGPGGFLDQRRDAAGGRVARPCEVCGRVPRWRDIGWATAVSSADEGAAGGFPGDGGPYGRARVDVLPIGPCVPCQRAREWRDLRTAVVESWRDLSDFAPPVWRRIVRDIGGSARRVREREPGHARRVVADRFGPVVAASVDMAAGVLPYVTRWDYAGWLAGQVVGRGLPIRGAWRQWVNNPRQDAYSRRAARRRARFDAASTRVGSAGVGPAAGEVSADYPGRAGG